MRAQLLAKAVYMSVSISQLRKDIEGIKNTLGERILFHEEEAVGLVKLVKEIISKYQSSKLFVLNEAGLAKASLDEFSALIEQAVAVNAEYEKFLALVGLRRVC
jgi:hypothetical protein